MSDVIQMYGGELVFDEGKHCYTFNGKPVPGVTTILGRLAKPALVPWASKMAADTFLKCMKSGRTDLDEVYKESKDAHKKRLKDAGDSGTNVHAYAEAYLKRLPLPDLETDEAKRGAEAFHKWLDAHKVEVLASERRVFSREHSYAGTCDLVARIDGRLAVGDFKTGSGIYPEMRFQTAAYQHAMQEEKDMRFECRWIIRFDKKNGKFEAKCFEEFDLDFQGFCAAMVLHKVLKTIETKKAEVW